MDRVSTLLDAAKERFELQIAFLGIKGNQPIERYVLGRNKRPLVVVHRVLILAVVLKPCSKE